MSRTFLPKAHYLPVGEFYRPMYRLFQEEPWKLVPKGQGYPSVGQAIAAADAYMAEKLNPTIQADRAELTKDVLGVAAWHEERAARAAQDQEAALGAVIVKGRQVKVERRRA